VSIPILHQPTLSFTEAARRRIYAPSAYERVRNIQTVPISLEEGLKFAGLLPLAWQRSSSAAASSSLQLVVIRSLLPDGRGHLDILRGNLAMLPRILYAYPFAMSPRVAANDVTVPLFCDDVADEPLDIGAPVATNSGLPTRATHLRLRALAKFDQELQVTNTLTAALQEANLFEPWNLSFQAGNEQVGVKDLWIVARSAFETGRFGPILARFDAKAALFLGHHRLSLFRVGVLVRQTEAAIGQKLVPATATRKAGGHA
jgi:SapC